MSENIGELKCQVCGKTEIMFIRKKKNNAGNYPLYLWHKNKGPDFYNTKTGQEYILENGQFYDELGNLPGQEPEPVKEQEPEPVKEQEPEPVKEKTDSAGWLI